MVVAAQCGEPCERLEVFVFGAASNYNSCPYRGSDTMMLRNVPLRFGSQIVIPTNGDDVFNHYDDTWKSINRSFFQGEVRVSHSRSSYLWAICRRKSCLVSGVCA